MTRRAIRTAAEQALQMPDKTYRYNYRKSTSAYAGGGKITWVNQKTEAVCLDSILAKVISENICFYPYFDRTLITLTS